MNEPLAELHAETSQRGGRLYLGAAGSGFVLGEPQHSALVLGPPRSGKTTSLAIPNILAAPGPVIVTSTKADVLAATLPARRRLGRCWLFDPTGSVRAPEGVTRVRWSPIAASGQWEDALLAARALAGAARPAGRTGESAHWTERAEALLAPLLHAAAVDGRGMDTVLSWVLRQRTADASEALRLSGPAVALDVLAGIEATDGRELSGIFSTAAGILAAYRSERVLDQSSPANFDPRILAEGRDTVYICAPARHQELVAPVAVAFLDSARSGAYERWAVGTAGHPLTLVLDELANIAPIPDLPSLISEGGGQGVLTVACIQDLSQARQRWGPAADGLLSLFGAKVVLPGIADLQTLELVSRLAGELEVPSRSVSRGPWWTGPKGAPTVSWSGHRQRRLPVDTVREQPSGSALLLSGQASPVRVSLPPWWALEPFRSATRSPAPSRGLGH